MINSAHFVPGHIEKFVDSINGLKASLILYDFEDSVPLDKKVVARHMLLDREHAFDRNVYVRVNELSSVDFEKDLECIKGATKVEGVMLSKLYSLDEAYESIARYESSVRKKLNFILLIETTAMLRDISSRVIENPSIVGLAFGGEDYITELGGDLRYSKGAFNFAKSIIVNASRASKLFSLDTPHLGLKDPFEIEQAYRESKSLGFDGRLTIHPLQSQIANAVFHPTQEELAWAKDVLFQLKKAKEKNSGVVLYNGKLIGPPMLKRAELIISKWRK